MHTLIPHSHRHLPGKGLYPSPHGPPGLPPELILTEAQLGSSREKQRGSLNAVKRTPTPPLGSPGSGSANGWRLVTIPLSPGASQAHPGAWPPDIQARPFLLLWAAQSPALELKTLNSTQTRGIQTSHPKLRLQSTPGMALPKLGWGGGTCQHSRQALNVSDEE